MSIITVIHKSTFKQSYINAQTGEIVIFTTQIIEEVWKIPKEYLRRINGTNTANFEEHFPEIIWRHHVHNDNIYEIFFQLAKSIFRLDCDPRYA